ncbi:MAG: hypothetical protein Q9212_006600 [Teloschistes hypoglaucus]
MPSISATLLTLTLLATSSFAISTPVQSNNIHLEPHTVIATSPDPISDPTLNDASSLFASLVSVASTETGSVSALSTITPTISFSAGMTSPSTTATGTGISPSTTVPESVLGWSSTIGPLSTISPTTSDSVGLTSPSVTSTGDSASQAGSSAAISGVTSSLSTISPTTPFSAGLTSPSATTTGGDSSTGPGSSSTAAPANSAEHRGVHAVFLLSVLFVFLVVNAVL